MRRVVLYFTIVVCGITQIAMVASTARFDLLTFLFLMTYLIVSLLIPTKQWRAAA